MFAHINCAGMLLQQSKKMAAMLIPVFLLSKRNRLRQKKNCDYEGFRSSSIATKEGSASGFPTRAENDILHSLFAMKLPGVN